MIKRVISSCVLIVLILIIPNSYVSSSELQKETIVNERKISNNLSVEVLDDGRISPIEKSIELSEDDLNLVLEEIGYDQKSIQSWSLEQKQLLASKGGKVVDSELVSLKREYISKDGETHKITPNNISEVRDFQLEDLKKIGVEGVETEQYNVLEEGKETSSTYSNLYANNGYKEDGIWSSLISVVYLGETSTQYKYELVVDYHWKKHPRAANRDSVGLYWGDIAQPVANTHAGVHAALYDGTWLNSSHDIDLSSTQGITSSFYLYSPNLATTPIKQTGMLLQDIMVSKRYSNHQLAISGKYIHPWTVANLSLSVGFNGFSISGTTELADVWSWQVNFRPN